MTFAISYGLSFASITATLTHALLYFRKQIWAQSRRSMHEQSDIHARLMSKYKQVPEWWYGIIFGTFVSCNRSSDTSNSCVHLTVSMVVFGIILIELWHTEFPVWAFLLALVIGGCFWTVKKLVLMWHSLLLCYTYWNDPGYYQPTGWSQVSLFRPFAVLALTSRSVVTELIIGYALPGRPIAMMMFKTWGYITMVQGMC